MASPASAARDIPKAVPLARDNLTVVADLGDGRTVDASYHVLPTPPNSISPALPAHGLKAQLLKAKLESVDSDLDLQDPIEADPPARSPSPAFHGASGAITSTLLAKHHLPEILLNHGPLAIRHIMGYLTALVPGFSAIPPTKARRLVVGALEGRGGDRGGPQAPENVEFEKVGWGRWDACQHGLAARQRQSTPPLSRPLAIPITAKSVGRRGSHDRTRASVSGSAGEGSIHFSHDGRGMRSVGTEADNMSMDDGSASASCSEAPDDDDAAAMNDDPDNVTDDEDWAAMGAAALRAQSYPNTAAAASPLTGNTHLSNSYLASALRAPPTSSGMARSPQWSVPDVSALEAAPGLQEREAVEALLRLGSI